MARDHDGPRHRTYAGTRVARQAPNGRHGGRTILQERRGRNMVEDGFVNDHRMRSTRYELLCQLAANGLIQMGPTGSWEVTRQGRDLIDRLDLLDELDGRDSGPGRGSS